MSWAPGTGPVARAVSGLTGFAARREGYSAPVELTRRKSVDEILAHSADTPGGDERGRLRKRLGALDLMGFGIGIVVGTGIFTLTGVAAKELAGPGVVLSFALAGVVSLLAALCYAELSSAVPTAGSAYTYAYATIGEVFAWIIGWDLILEFALGAAVVARGTRYRRRCSARTPRSTSGRCSSPSSSARSPTSGSGRPSG
jgi:APA family basic amino acid/polyamine antiporter